MCAKAFKLVCQRWGTAWPPENPTFSELKWLRWNPLEIKVTSLKSSCDPVVLYAHTHTHDEKKTEKKKERIIVPPSFLSFLFIPFNLSFRPFICLNGWFQWAAAKWCSLILWLNLHCCSTAQTRAALVFFNKKKKEHLLTKHMEKCRNIKKQQFICTKINCGKVYKNIEWFEASCEGVWADLHLWSSWVCKVIQHWIWPLTTPASLWRGPMSLWAYGLIYSHLLFDTRQSARSDSSLTFLFFFCSKPQNINCVFVNPLLALHTNIPEKDRIALFTAAREGNLSVVQKQLEGRRSHLINLW